MTDFDHVIPIPVVLDDEDRAILTDLGFDPDAVEVTYGWDDDYDHEETW